MDKRKYIEQQDCMFKDGKVEVTIDNKLMELLLDEKTSGGEYVDYFVDNHSILIDPDETCDLLDEKRNLVDSLSDAKYIVVNVKQFRLSELGKEVK